MTTTKFFFDTEFTGLHKNTTLISIGMISEDGKTTFYAELTDYSKEQINPWLQENVIDNLNFKDKEPGIRIEPFLFGAKSMECKGTKKQVREWIRGWLDQFSGNKEFVSDVCHYDMVLLVDLLSDTALDLPDNIGAACHDINQDIASFEKVDTSKAFDMSREDLLSVLGSPIKGAKHNALYDAKVIRAIHVGMKNFYENGGNIL